jgi:hypothetical protein
VIFKTSVALGEAVGESVIDVAEVGETEIEASAITAVAEL